MLREVDPEFFVGPKQSTVLWENSRRQEAMRSGIRMTTELAMGAVFLTLLVERD
jgi:hypothetical protein